MPRGGQAPQEWPEKTAHRVSEVAIEYARHVPGSVYITLPFFFITVADTRILRTHTITHKRKREELACTHVEIVVRAQKMCRWTKNVCIHTNTHTNT